MNVIVIICIVCLVYHIIFKLAKVMYLISLDDEERMICQIYCIWPNWLTIFATVDILMRFILIIDVGILCIWALMALLS